MKKGQNRGILLLMGWKRTCIRCANCLTQGSMGALDPSVIRETLLE